MKKLLTESENLRRLSTIVDETQLNEYFVQEGMTLEEVFNSIFPDPVEEEEFINNEGFGLQALTAWHDAHTKIKRLEQAWAKYATVRVTNRVLARMLDQKAGYLEYSIDDADDYMIENAALHKMIEFIESLQPNDLTDQSGEEFE